MRTVAVPLFWLFWHHCNMPVSQMQLDIHPLCRSLLLQGSESLLHLCNYVLSRQLFNTTAWLAWSQLPWPLNPLQLLIGHSTRQLTTWTLHDKLPRSVMYSFLSVISLYLLFSWLSFMFMQVLNTKNIQALHTCVCVHRFLSYSESLWHYKYRLWSHQQSLSQSRKPFFKKANKQTNKISNFGLCYCERLMTLVALSWISRGK